MGRNKLTPEQQLASKARRRESKKARRRAKAQALPPAERKAQLAAKAAKQRTRVSEFSHEERERHKLAASQRRQLARVNPAVKTRDNATAKRSREKKAAAQRVQLPAAPAPERADPVAQRPIPASHRPAPALERPALAPERAEHIEPVQEPAQQAAQAGVQVANAPQQQTARAELLRDAEPPPVDDEKIPHKTSSDEALPLSKPRKRQRRMRCRRYGATDHLRSTCKRCPMHPDFNATLLATPVSPPPPWLPSRVNITSRYAPQPGVSDKLRSCDELTDSIELL